MTAPADPAPASPDQDSGDGVTRIILIVLIVLGVLIVAGFVFIAVEVARRVAARSAAAAEAPAPMTTAGGVPRIDLGGGRIQDMIAVGNRLAVTTADADGALTIHLIDPRAPELVGVVEADR